jgi:DNA invertase Pin-like site-specific DNA recombinase
MLYEIRPGEIKSTTGLRAARYVRMSTDQQRYSTENQADAIAAYAASRGITIVRHYADEGRSGLSLDRRDALKTLIGDVRAGRADFHLILVYDVSRWGRFQDADESAYYEFICKEAGIQVHYCAEQFENDGSLTSTILKNMKRAMAGEYSRELSAKVFIGQCRIVTLGFWRGGPPGYGLRRQLLDEHGTPKALLQYGQHKSIQTDRVVLKHGPASEVRTVRRIFNSFVAEKKCVTDIAAELNADQIRTARGNVWKAQTIDKILLNEAYAGNMVFNRTSFKLHQKVVLNPPDMWIRRDNAIKPIIAPDIFAKASEIIARRRQRLSDEDVLNSLKKLWRKKGHLSCEIIGAAKGVPDLSTFTRRFGSVVAAYKLIGFRPKARYRWIEAEARICSIVGDAIANCISRIEKLGGRATFNEYTRLMTVNDGFVVSIGSARCRAEGLGQVRWTVRIDRQATADLALIFRMDALNSRVRDYYLLPAVELAQVTVKRLRISSRVFSKSSRYDSLDEFYRICSRGVASSTHLEPSWGDVNG